jgi:hypothetical protein
MQKDRRGDKTAIELFCLGLTGWDAGSQRLLDDVKALQINWAWF